MRAPHVRRLPAATALLLAFACACGSPAEPQVPRETATRETAAPPSPPDAPGPPAALPIAPAAPTAAPLDIPADIAFWKSRAERDPADYIARTRLGIAVMQHARATGDDPLYREAETHLRRALQTAPRDRDALVALSFTLGAQHRFEEALTVARRAAEVDPTHEETLAALGDAALELGDLPAARTAFEAIVAEDRSLFALTRLANLERVAGHAADAVELWGEAADVGATRGVPVLEIARCHVNIGDVHATAGQAVEAEAAYERAREVWPEGYLPRERLAALRHTQGRDDEAAALYEQILERVERAPTLLALSELRELAGDARAARRLRERAAAATLR